MTAALVDASPDYARQLTDRIKVAVEGTWHLITEAYQSRAWAALGYTSWDDYTTREFGTSRLRLPREERTEIVGSLRDAGLSLRAIAAVTGDSVTTVRRELAGVPNGTPDVEVEESATPTKTMQEHFAEAHAHYDDAADLEAEVSAALNEPESVEPVAAPEPTKVTGTDGKSYTVPTPAPKAERRPDLTATARNVTTDLGRIVNRLIKLREDDRFSRNAEQVASLIRGDLSDAIEVCQDLLDAFPSN